MPPYPDLTTLVFQRKVHEYAEVYSYFFTPTKPVTFTAGQYAHVRLLSLPETTRRVREISFASAPHDTEIQFTIDGSSGSDYQVALKSLIEGDSIEIFKIKGHMTWPNTASHSIMIAGGIGVTPFRSMLRDKTYKNLEQPITLLHVARENFLYEEELQKLGSDFKKIHREGLISELDEIVHTHPSAHYYVAGSLNFVNSVKEELTKKGISLIETDEFKGLPDFA